MEHDIWPEVRLMFCTATFFSFSHDLNYSLYLFRKPSWAEKWETELEKEHQRKDRENEREREEANKRVYQQPADDLLLTVCRPVSSYVLVQWKLLQLKTSLEGEKRQNERERERERNGDEERDRAAKRRKKRRDSTVLSSTTKKLCRLLSTGTHRGTIAIMRKLRSRRVSFFSLFFSGCVTQTFCTFFVSAFVSPAS